jgi:hypothetical protein
MNQLIEGIIQKAAIDKGALLDAGKSQKPMGVQAE